MIRLILQLVTIALAIVLALFLADHPGRVTLHWLGWRIDGSAAFLIVALVLLIGAMWGLVALLLRLWRAPARLARRRREARRLRGHRALTDGLVAIAAGDLAAAERFGRRAEQHFRKAKHESPPLTRLLAAQTALLRQDHATAKNEFTALAEQDETRFLGLRGLIVQALKSGDEVTALRLVERADQLRPGTGWVLQTRFGLEARAREWRRATETLVTAARRRAIGADDQARHKIALLIARSEEAEQDARPRDALTFAAQAYQLNPAFAPAAVRYANLLATGNQQRKAVRVLETSWARSGHPDIAALYSRLVADDAPATRLQRFERLIKARPHDREAHLAAAEIALSARLWGEARRHLDLAGAAGPGPYPARLCFLAAELAEGEHKDSETAQRWRARIAGGSEPPRWTCHDCAAEQSAWSPLCATCGAFDTFEWRIPHRRAPRSAVPGPDQEFPLLILDRPAQMAPDARAADGRRAEDAARAQGA